MPKVKVAYQTIKEVEIEVDKKYAGCIYFADAPWEFFNSLDHTVWEEYDRQCEKMHYDIDVELSSEDPFFDHIVAITTENDNCIYED